MAKIRINNKPYDVESAMLEQIASRLQTRLIQVKNTARSVPVDYRSVRAELVRLFPALPVKPWFWDFVVQFCRERNIDCPAQDDGGKTFATATIA